MNDLKLWKYILEIRHPASSLFFDNRGKIANRWQWTNDLSEWRISNNQLTVYNRENSTFLNAGFKNISVSMELPENLNSFCSLAAEFSSYVIDLLELKNIQRIGYRMIQIAPRKHTKLLTNTIRKNVFGLTDEDWNIFQGPPVDLAFPLVFQLEQSMLNFNIGPMAIEQLSGHFESQEVKNKLPKVAFFMDMDAFQINPDLNISESKSYISEFIKTSANVIDDISLKVMERYGF